MMSGLISFNNSPPKTPVRRKNHLYLTS